MNINKKTPPFRRGSLLVGLTGLISLLIARYIREDIPLHLNKHLLHKRAASPGENYFSAGRKKNKSAILKSICLLQPMLCKTNKDLLF